MNEKGEVERRLINISHDSEFLMVEIVVALLPQTFNKLIQVGAILWVCSVFSSSRPDTRSLFSLRSQSHLGRNYCTYI
jgi:hypothetical protein